MKALYSHIKDPRPIIINPNQLKIPLTKPSKKRISEIGIVRLLAVIFVITVIMGLIVFIGRRLL